MFFNRDKEIDVDQLREQLIIDEGQVNEIYHDHLGYPTFGIGHLVIEGDPEYGMEVGTPVAEDRVIEVFAKETSGGGKSLCLGFTAHARGCPFGPVMEETAQEKCIEGDGP